ncbi:MAG: glutaconate CoA-transferase, subunit [Clostridiales bacterium]|nr:glutaconate CoA-transferase, subunit [Clostridiales bacterium]
MSKEMTLSEAVRLIHDGDMLALGGNVLHRAPMSLIREIARQKKKHLKIVKTAGAMDVDLLCMANCVDSVDAGFISYESEYSLANHYRRAVQSGQVAGNEHACYTVISALRAASMGVGFLPVRGLIVSDLISVNSYFARIQDPFSNEEITVVKALCPDYALLHVNEADVNGNAYIEPPLFDDIIMSRAAKGVILTTEKIVPENKFSFSKEKAQIPQFLVRAVVQVKKGAAPCSCYPSYDIDKKGISAFKDCKSENDLNGYLEQMEAIDWR